MARDLSEWVKFTNRYVIMKYRPGLLCKYSSHDPAAIAIIYHFHFVLVVSQEWSWWRSFDSIPLQELKWSICIPAQQANDSRYTSYVSLAR